MAQKRRILLVDDEANFRWSIERVLQLRGYDVVSAESAEVALDTLKTSRFDLVITDIRMPGMDGFELVSWLRTNRPDIRVLMTTAFGSLHTREQSYQLGALSYLEKPVDLGELTDFLQHIFSQDGFAGRVKDIELSDYIQLLANTRREKVLEVSSLSGSGRIWLSRGQVVHAKTEEMQGSDAFFEILSWSGGDFSDQSWSAPSEESIGDSISYLLMEAARRKDDANLAQTQSEKATPAWAEEDDATDLPTPSSLLDTQYAPQAEASPIPVASNHYESALQGLENITGLEGALLLRTNGNLLARRGEIAQDIERLLLPLYQGCVGVGSSLSLGRYDEAILHLQSGHRILLEPLGDLLLGLYLTQGADPAQLRTWIREVAQRAG